jgi:hypothetical protein
MAMELGTARWTSTNPHPFAPAPGGGTAGLGSTRWTSTVPTPFGPAPGAGSFGEVYNSGFAATRNGQIIQTAPGKKTYVEMDAELERVRGPFRVVEGPRKDGEVPSLVLNMRFTSRGTVTKELLDKTIRDVFKDAKFKVSRATSFKSARVSWGWGKIGAQAAGDVPLYVPRVASGPYKGLGYRGPLLTAPGLYEPDSQLLAKMPSTIWVYSLALTTAHNTMSDGDAAQALTLLKQAVADLSAAASGGVLGHPGAIITRRTCPHSIFGQAPVDPIPKPVKTGFSALLLLVAYNMLSPHIGSEVL